MDVRRALRASLHVVASRPVRVALADPRPLVRHVLRFLLEDAGAQVVGEADSGRGAIELVGRRRPDVLILHETVPIDRSANPVAAIRSASPGTRIVVLSVLGEPRLARADRRDAGPGAWAQADAVVPEDLPFEWLRELVTRRAGRVEDADPVPASSIQDPDVDGRSTGSMAEPAPRRRSIAALAAACVVVVAMALAGGLTRSSPGAARATQRAKDLHVAFAALDDLVRAIRHGSSAALVDAQRLAGSWARAAEAGADVSGLLDEIRSRIPRALSAGERNHGDRRHGASGQPHGAGGSSGAHRADAGRGSRGRPPGHARGHGRGRSTGGEHVPHGRERGRSTALDHRASAAGR